MTAGFLYSGVPLLALGKAVVSDSRAYPTLAAYLHPEESAKLIHPAPTADTTVTQELSSNTTLPAYIQTTWNQVDQPEFQRCFEKEHSWWWEPCSQSLSELTP